MKNLVTNRNKNVASTKVNTKVDSSGDLNITSVPKITKKFQKSRQKAHENRSNSSESNEGLGISHADAAKSVSEPSLAAQFSVSKQRNRGDAFVREASSITSLTSSSATQNNKTGRKGSRYLSILIIKNS